MSRNGSVSSDDVIRLLKERQGDDSLRKFALDIGVSAAYLSDLYRGNRNPGNKIFKALGLKLTLTGDGNRRRKGGTGASSARKRSKVDEGSADVRKVVG